MVDSRTRPAVGSWAFFIAIVAVTVAYFFLSEETQSVVYDLVAVAAAVAMGLGVLRARPEQTFAWTLLCLGVGLWALGDIVFGTSQPVPSPADVLYISAYPLLALGVLGLARIEGGRWHESILTDAFVLAAAIAVVAAVFLLAPAGHPRGVGLAGRVVAVGYPVMDLALLAGVVRAWRRTSSRNTVLALFGLAIVARCLADTGYALQGFGASYVVGNPVDAAFLVSYALAGASLLHPSLAPIRPDRTPVPVRPLAREVAASPILVASGPTAVALRLRVVLAWAGLMLLALAGTALVLSVAWREADVAGVAGAYGMTGTLMLAGSAIRG